MKKGERSKARILEATGHLLARQGYHGTGLAQIVKEADAPRGSLYFHFPGGKEEIAARALVEVGRRTRGELATALEGARSVGDALDALLGYFAEQLRASDFELGCPVATVALEAAATSAPVREAALEVYGAWQELATRFAHGVGLEGDAANDMGLAILSTIEGALLLARVQRSTEPLEASGRVLRKLLGV